MVEILTDFFDSGDRIATRNDRRGGSRPFLFPVPCSLFPLGRAALCRPYGLLPIAYSINRDGLPGLPRGDRPPVWTGSHMEGGKLN